MTEQATINMADFMVNAQGHLVPKSKVAEVDKLRDQTVQELTNRALSLHHTMRDFQNHALDTVAAFVECSAEEHGVKWGGKKGNIKLTSFDGTRQVMIDIQERIGFSEKLAVAKDILDDFLKAEMASASDSIRAIVFEAFDVDRDGKLNTRRILGLRRIKIDDPDWLRAMEVISEALQLEGSKEYLRVYTRPSPRSKWQLVNLNMSSI